MKKAVNEMNGLSDFWKRIIWLVGAGAIFALGSLGGCGNDLWTLPADEPMTVVITFDDGPMPANIAKPAEAEDKQTLLQPLEQILATLKSYGVQAVFYIKGPGSKEAGTILADDYIRAIAEMQSAGHITGYHAYDHESAIWGKPTHPPLMREQEMKNDLEALKAYVEDISGGELSLYPIFRQPYGGDRICWVDGWIVATQLGMTYHGYAIDSFDWTENADADSKTTQHLPVRTEEDHLNFVLKCFHEQAGRHANDAVVDILFHVNAFTAAHLPEFLDTLRTEFENATGRSVAFTVPASYLSVSDLNMDTLIYDYLFLGR